MWVCVIDAHDWLADWLTNCSDSELFLFSLCFTFSEQNGQRRRVTKSRTTKKIRKRANRRHQLKSNFESEKKTEEEFIIKFRTRDFCCVYLRRRHQHIICAYTHYVRHIWMCGIERTIQACASLRYAFDISEMFHWSMPSVVVLQTTVLCLAHRNIFGSLKLVYVYNFLLYTFQIALIF